MAIALDPQHLPEVSDVSDEALADRVKAGDTASFELLMRRNNRSLFRVVRSIMRNQTEAEDVMQDAYFRAFSHIQQFEGRALFRTWLTRIAINECHARLRKAARSVPLENEDLRNCVPMFQHESSQQKPEDDATRQELRRVLQREIEALPAANRTVLVLRDIEELSTEEAAQCLGISTTNVRIRLYRARKILRRNLETKLGDISADLYQFGGGQCDRVVAQVMERIAAH